MTKDRLTAEEYQAMTGQAEAPTRERPKGKSEKEEFIEGIREYLSPQHQENIRNRRIVGLIERYAPLMFESGKPGATLYELTELAVDRAHALATAVIQRCATYERSKT